MSKRHRDYDATRVTGASLRARPIKNIPAGTSGDDKAEVFPGSPPLARSQGPRKVTSGTGSTVKRAQGQRERQARPRRTSAIPRTVSRRERTMSEGGRPRTCECEGCRKDNCRLCARC